MKSDAHRSELSVSLALSHRHQSFVDAFKLNELLDSLSVMASSYRYHQMEPKYKIVIFNQVVDLVNLVVL